MIQDALDLHGFGDEADDVHFAAAARADERIDLVYAPERAKAHSMYSKQQLDTIVPMATRLFAIVARTGRRVVVFRRGPSKQVRMLLWHLDSDTFEPGQWLKARVYERRCDLSPNGTKLIYFAADWRPGFGSWTAISTPPYFTALAVWPKGDAWGGGGLFESPITIALNHPSSQTTLAEGFKLGRRMKVVPFGQFPGRGEDDPIYDARLRRDGWTCAGEVGGKKHPFGNKIWIEYDPPLIYTKPSPTDGRLLAMKIRGIKEQDGPWYVIDHAVGDTDLERTDWADWDANGDLLFAREGRIYRQSSGDPVELIDLCDDTFEEVPPPTSATRWNG